MANMYCKECGNQIADSDKFCANCGKLQSGEIVSNSTNPKSSNADYAKPSHSGDAPDFGFALLSFLVPLFGLIYWAIKRNEAPLRAGSCIKGAIWCFFVLLFLLFLHLLFFLLLLFG